MLAAFVPYPNTFCWSFSLSFYCSLLKFCDLTEDWYCHLDCPSGRLVQCHATTRRTHKFDKCMCCPLLPRAAFLHLPMLCSGQAEAGSREAGKQSIIQTPRDKCPSTITKEKRMNNDDNPFFLLLNPLLILKTSVHLQFWKFQIGQFDF